MRQLIVLAGATDVTISGVALAHTRMDCPNHQPASTNPYLTSTVRAELIGHYQPCMTDIYLHLDARMADYIRTHP